MTFVPARGRWTSKRYSTKASTAYAVGDVVYSDGTDILPMVATGEDALGIVAEAKASGDATTTPIKILVPADSSSLAKVDVGTGTLTAAYNGRLCDPDDTNPKTQIDIGTTTESTYRIEKFLTSAIALVSFSPTKR